MIIFNHAYAKALRYKEIDRIGHRSKSIAGEVISFELTDFPKDVRTMFNQYRRTVPIYG